MPHILERRHFSNDFVLRELFTSNVFVLEVIRTINATIDAVIRQIQRRKHHDAIAIVLLLDFSSELVDLFVYRRIVTSEQYRCFAMRESFVFAGFFEDFDDRLVIGCRLFGIRQRVEYFSMIDKFFCF